MSLAGFVVFIFRTMPAVVFGLSLLLALVSRKLWMEYLPGLSAQYSFQGCSLFSLVSVFWRAPRVFSLRLHADNRKCASTHYGAFFQVHSTLLILVGLVGHSAACGKIVLLSASHGEMRAGATRLVKLDPTLAVRVQGGIA